MTPQFNSKVAVHFDVGDQIDSAEEIRIAEPASGPFLASAEYRNV